MGRWLRLTDGRPQNLVTALAILVLNIDHDKARLTVEEELDGSAIREFSPGVEQFWFRQVADLGDGVACPDAMLLVQFDGAALVGDAIDCDHSVSPVIGCWL